MEGARCECKGLQVAGSASVGLEERVKLMNNPLHPEYVSKAVLVYRILTSLGSRKAKTNVLRALPVYPVLKIKRFRQKLH